MNFQTKKSLQIILIFIISLQLFSCGIFKKNHKKDNKNDISVIKNKFIDSVENAYLEFNTLKIKFSSKYETKTQNMSIGGRINMDRDSFIRVSLSPGMGIELARILLTKDSVKFINRLKSEYFVGDYEYIKKRFGIEVDFLSVQAILTDEFFTYPNSNNAKESLKPYKFTTDSLFCFFTKEISDSIVHKIEVDKNSYKISKVNAVFKNKKEELSLEYTDFQILTTKKFPQKIDINFGKETDKTSFLLTYDKIYVNKEVSASFKISSKYKRIEF